MIVKPFKAVHSLLKLCIAYLSLAKPFEAFERGGAFRFGPARSEPQRANCFCHSQTTRVYAFCVCHFLSYLVIYDAFCCQRTRHKTRG